MPYRRRELRTPGWSEAVQILARRKVLFQNYRRVVGQLRCQRQATAEYWQSPSVSARETVILGKQELKNLLDSYLQTLAELRLAAETVFHARKPGNGRRRTLVRR
jgi:hypothetical protein